MFGPLASYNIDLAVIGLFKTEVIQRLGPWRNLDGVEVATLTWVDWFNTRRLLEPIGYVPPAEFEGATMSRPQWPDSIHWPSEIPGTVQERNNGYSSRPAKATIHHFPARFWKPTALSPIPLRNRSSTNP